MNALDRIIRKYAAIKDKAPSQEEKEKDNEEAKAENMDAYCRACARAEEAHNEEGEGS